ncbi:NACHT domain-containing protein [Nodosilinea sp. AN01ver1]|uniref:NACHT domain-containing protein n=1 Tax=Nodosilinea sp. AN01ver1 TaxID=3423362 RepID=UPI003D3198EA
MARRSLTATPNGIQQINRALTERGWSRDDLMKECSCSRQPAIKFCSGKAVSNKLFVTFCKTLDLDWEDIAGQKSASLPDKVKEPETDIDALVKTVRAQVHDDIQARCGTMRVLDMEQPIGLDNIYTNVNILEKLTGNQRLDPDRFLKDFKTDNFEPDNFNRFLLGRVRHPKIPGLQAVEEHGQLMILGKPGAGKTTFMKRLAILCNRGKFQPHWVPIFVTLKDYAEAPVKPTLQIYMQTQWQSCGVKEADALATILTSGKALVLLDGLDEVQSTDHDRVLQDIKTFVNQFRDCQCVITCRIAAQEYTFEQFTEVEVADFDQKQIADFATKWFSAKHDPQKATIFIQRLKDNEPIQELATNPLLLTLLCLIFGEAADFPANRAELYKEGLDVLLKKWDGKRNIERDQVYKKLSLKRKEDLLSQLAFETFERGDYFFRQATAEQHIICYIRNLPGASDDDEVLQLDSEAVLKSIQAQHGILVERAKGIYSFSHLTFQEYFTAQYIISPTASLNQALQNLTTHITQKRYREIFLLTAGMLPEANTLLLLLKRQIDQLIVDSSIEEPKLQAVLAWVQQKTSAVQASYKATAIRAFYFGLNFDQKFDLTLARSIDRTLNIDLSRVRTLDYALALDYTLVSALNSNPNISVLDHDLYSILKRIYNLNNESVSLSMNESNFKLNLEIEKLRNESFISSDKLRKIMIEYRNIGYNWQLTKTQKGKLRQYYDANQVLVDCLNSDCYVAKATRQYIEDTLLLPLSEIEKYPVPDAIANL